MQKRFIVLTMLVPIAAVCASSGASGQVLVPPAVAHFPAFQDSTVEMSLRNAGEVLANVQRLLDDTTVLGAANRASQRAATLSARNAREVLANVQRLLDDTTILAAANRASEKAATLSAQFRDLDAQQAALEERLQQTDAHLRTVFQQLERIQRRVDEMMRQQPN